MTSDNEETSEKIVFKKKKIKALRKRKVSSSDENSDNEDVNRSKLEELMTVQKLRERPKGVNIVGLALGDAVSSIDVIVDSDPFKVKTGGMINMAALKKNKIKQDDTYDTGIGTQFNAETNKRDEDDEMVKYIEEELQKRKNNNITDQDDDTDKNKMYFSPEEAALQAVPEHLRQNSSIKSEEMLSNQMLSGIPEVDLGIDAKIRNIEATEEAKLKLLWERQKKKDGPSHFVPTNMAVNFVQHNRFSVDDEANKRKGDKSGRNRNTYRPSHSKDKRKDDEKATDDFHYERFKKQFRRF